MTTYLTAKAAHQTLAALFVGAIAFSASFCLAQTVSPDPPYSVVERGPFYNVLQRTVSVTNLTGEISQQIQSYTDLQDGENSSATACGSPHKTSSTSHLRVHKQSTVK